MSVIATKRMRDRLPPKPSEQRSLSGNNQGADASFDALALLQRHLLLIGAVILCGTLMAALASFMLPKEYMASATLAFERSDTQFSLAEETLKGSAPNVAALATEADVITSRQFGGRVVDALSLVDDPVFNPYLSEGDAHPDRLPELSEQREGVITRFLSRISVARENTSLSMRINATHPDPSQAAAVANAVADTYVEHSLELKRSAINTASVLVSGRLTQMGKRIAETERKIADHLREHQLDIDGQENRRESQLRAKITQFEAQLQLLRERQSDNASASAADQIARINAKLATLEDELERLTLADIRHRALEQELTTYRDQYRLMVERLVTLEGQADLRTPSARVISEAAVPTTPSFPKRNMIIAGGFLGSAMIALLVALLVDELFTRIRTDQHILQASGLSNLASIPEARDERTNNPAQPVMYLKEHPGSFFAEAIRSLFTAWRRSDVDQRPKVLMLASALPAEGKSTIAVGLAITAARLGHKVILVDLDLHRGGVSAMLNAAVWKSQLEAYLDGKASLADAIVEADPEVPGLDVIATVPSTIPPSTLLSSERLAELLSALRRDYDLVILDTPAALVVNDVSYLSGFVDTALLVVRWGHTTEKAFTEAVRRLRMNQIPLTGTAINRVKARTHARYGYGSASAYYKGA